MTKKLNADRLTQLQTFLDITRDAAEEWADLLDPERHGRYGRRHQRDYLVRSLDRLAAAAKTARAFADEETSS